MNAFSHFTVFVGVACGMAAITLAAAPAPVGAVVLCAEAEKVGRPSGVLVTPAPEALGGSACALAADAYIAWGLRLPAGDYTVFIRAFAPAGDQDALFMAAGPKRERFTVPIGSWGQRAMVFGVADAELTCLHIDGQEPGLLLDRIAVLRGRFAATDVDLATLAPMGLDTVIPPDQLPLAEQPCRLAEFPPVGSPDTTGFLVRQGFEPPLRGGISGHHELVPGRWGTCLVLGLPDGRYDIRFSTPPLPGNTGTVEWWVRPRPAANVWRDQGWHYFLSAAPAEGSTVRLDLSRHVATGLMLALSSGPEGTPATLAMDSSSLDPEAWHHLLISWDLAAKPQRLWLLLDGKGRRLNLAQRFPPCSFRTLSFGNSPPDGNLPFLPMDGAIDQISVSTESVQTRLAP